MKYMDPMVIPKFGCASFNSRGEICKGSKELDKNKWCKKCLCFDETKEK